MVLAWSLPHTAFSTEQPVMAAMLYASASDESVWLNVKHCIANASLQSEAVKLTINSLWAA